MFLLLLLFFLLFPFATTVLYPYHVLRVPGGGIALILPRTVTAILFYCSMHSVYRYY